MLLGTDLYNYHWVHRPSIDFQPNLSTAIYILLSSSLAMYKTEGGVFLNTLKDGEHWNCTIDKSIIDKSINIITSNTTLILYDKSNRK